MKTIHYSDGSAKPSRIEIWDDLHTERAGMFRAFWCEPGSNTGSPVIGYCSPGGSQRTIRAAAAEVRRLYPNEPIYRNGREVTL